MKVKILVICFFMFSACSSSIKKQQEFAKEKFIEEKSIMTEIQALSHEVDYYKAPQIIREQHIRSLTGRDLIKECNKIIEEDQNSDYIQMGPSSFKRVRKVHDVKEYALQHPDNIIANEFALSGVFTTYSEKNKYEERSSIIIVVPKLERCIFIQ